MQIHELNTFQGTPGATDYLAIDDGSQTSKIAASELGTVLVLSVSSFSSLPKTVTDSKISSDMMVINSELGTPSAQTGDWTVTTSNGSLQITGSNAISGSTTLKLYLMKSR